MNLAHCRVRSGGCTGTWTCNCLCLRCLFVPARALCVVLAFCVHAFLGCTLIACGGRAFTAGSELTSLPTADAGDELADAARETTSPATSSAPYLEDASSPVPADAGDELGPTCMFGACSELAKYGMRFTCGTWCCNREDACDAPATSLCSAGACGMGNSNTTCERAGFLFCCAPSPGCP